MPRPKTALATLGWRVDTSARLTQAIMDFQRCWNLGVALKITGIADPPTVAALDLSLALKGSGQPDISAHFSAREFACQCGGKSRECRRIWVARPVIQVAEQYRQLVGPFSPVRACRCPLQNRAVGGKRNSMHLYGLALDLPVYTVTAKQVKGLRSVSGIGVYTAGRRKVVRHVDARHLADSDRTGGTIASPVIWDYGVYRRTPLAPKPQFALATLFAAQEDDMYTDEDRKRDQYISTQVKAVAQLIVDRHLDADLIADRVAAKLGADTDTEALKVAIREVLAERTE